MGIFGFGKKKNYSDPRKAIYEAELEKAKVRARKQKAENEINAIKKIAQERANREVLKPSRMERLAKLGESMQEAQKGYESFFAPNPKAKKKYEVPDFV